ETRIGTLSIIFCHEGVWNPGLAGAAASKRGHDDPVGQPKLAKHKGLKENAHRSDFSRQARRRLSRNLDIVCASGVSPVSSIISNLQYVDGLCSRTSLKCEFLERSRSEADHIFLLSLYQAAA